MVLGEGVLGLGEGQVKGNDLVSELTLELGKWDSELGNESTDV